MDEGFVEGSSNSMEIHCYYYKYDKIYLVYSDCVDAIPGVGKHMLSIRIINRSPLCAELSFLYQLQYCS
jgi:hypothetical protein